MTRSQLVDRVAARMPAAPRREVERIVNALFESMVEALKREERIEIRGFGSFAVKVRDPRQARNPRTGEQVTVPTRRTPYFTVGKELRERLNRDAPENEVPAETTGPRAVAG